MKRRDILTGLAGILAVGGYAPSFAHSGILMRPRALIERRPVKWIVFNTEGVDRRIVRGSHGDTLTVAAPLEIRDGTTGTCQRLQVSATMPTGTRLLQVEGLRVPLYLDNFQLGTAEIDYREI